MKVNIVSAWAFVDWDSARRLKRPPWGFEDKDNVPLRDRIEHIKDCFLEIQTRTSKVLSESYAGTPIRVIRSKIYHGWHRGKMPTEDRVAWQTAKLNFQSYVFDDVSFLADTEYGNNLECGGDRVPLMDTVRKRPGKPDEQKMVDTALVADLLSYCRTESRDFRKGERPNAMALVIGNDDDLLPGVFTAERWGLPIAVLRANRENESRSLNIENLIYKL